ncbi:hypothetical protein [Piscirickettsia salmonis]|uniref:Membrane protein n=1 Tax=Piscirickettsia salmonis TaxID=1238 RepID=A0A1L6TGC6_PISSA|nr:hypothetical protein [Piscirickettsia salmonis]AKP72847.1 hypothetical protein PSLF89_753 [Piscirickettsia salmonis LF-89 = ATCC VR-1361]ALB21460.1 membrane protein [Piscirickettsia salmonis]ALY01684.1 hypothetical protein AWE47_01375 [Piscirickettsia salmonis]AMA41200.1 hypothetical protein AWJ11_01385 [Piscirickettsia salmonis]AOS36389.1 hypothetical protein AVM72_14370 [Piscirickettsia salmonis]
MLTKSLLLLSVAGAMNGSFVTPSRYIKTFSYSVLWLIYSFIGLIVTPWAALFMTTNIHLTDYQKLTGYVSVMLIIGGLVFGFGQIALINAIRRVGLALSFAVNLGVGVALGSLFTFFYKAQGVQLIHSILIISAVFLIVIGLIMYYFSFNIEKRKNKNSFYMGWMCAFTAGLASGFQNVVFIIAISNSSYFSGANLFWVWPPFLSVAGLITGAYFLFNALNYDKESCINKNLYNLQLLLKNLFLITVMGILFTGSLALYSLGMYGVDHKGQVIGWPIFIVLIILSSQLWGWVYKENINTSRKQKIFAVSSIFLFLFSIVILSLST